MKPVFASAEEAKWGGLVILIVAVIILLAVGYQIHALMRWGMVLAAIGCFIVIHRLVHGIMTGDWR